MAESPAARAERTVESAQPTQPGSAHGHSVQSATALRALRAEELARARGFGRVVALLSLVAMIPVVLVALSNTTQPEWLAMLMAGALAGTLSTGVIVWLRVRHSPNPRRMMRIFGAFCFVNALSTQYYAGVFSPAPAVVALGISYFGLADDRRFGYFTCIGVSVAYAVIAALVSFGVVPDYGLFPIRDVPPLLRVVAVSTCLCVYAVMIWQARLSRDATHQAVEKLDEALRLVQQREALLEEANLNLDAALAAPAGRRGLYTGRVAGAYQLGEVLGRGGMGEVYAARHAESGREAAVKLLHGKALSSASLVQRFLREAEVALALRAPNLVEIFELGQADDGAPFIAMELLVGHDLGWHLRRRRQMPLADVVALAADVARGLEVAHERGVVHRDLKPANLFLVDGERARWKILDFGVAKLRGSTGTLTQRTVVGTPGYMSPEQAQGHDVDARSDVFSLGAVVYRALTGRPPFSAPDTPQVLFDIVYKNPARPSELEPSLTAEVDAALAIALAKDREVRFACPSDFAQALADAARGAMARGLRGRAHALLAELPWGRTARPK
jgi:eukaryotic-like serine/threonine-protein kinase